MNNISNQQDSSHLEFEDAYIIEEKNMKIAEDEEDDDELKELSLDSLEISEDEYTKLNLDYEKLKIVAAKKKVDKSMDKTKIHYEFLPGIVKREEVVEDYIRNFFVQYNLNKALSSFNLEYNELVKKGKFYDSILGPISDVRIKNAKLEDKLKKIEKELEIAGKTAEQAKSKWESLRKERDFHKENYYKTISEKQIIGSDIKKLKELHKDYSDKIQDLSKKYEHLYKQKSLRELENEKLRTDCSKLEQNISKMQREMEKMDSKPKEIIDSKEEKIKMPEKKLKPGELTPWPSDLRNNLYLLQTYSQLNSIPNCIKEIKAHDKSVASLSVHIKKHVVATGGDDAKFKIFNMTNYEELASGEGHTDYISGIDIHSKGSYLVTSSGDHTIKLWDLFNIKCKATFYDHNSIVWSVKFHDTGDFFVSCSEDSTVRVFDVNAMKCRDSFMGHSSSVNKVEFQPFTNYFATCSVDKTISIWDLRSKHPVQTYYGHLNSVNSVIFNPKGDKIHSCDSDGIIKTWDVRTVKEENSNFFYRKTKISANCIEIDKSESYLYVGLDNGEIGYINLQKDKEKNQFKAHERAVNQLGINLSNSHLYSVGGDGALKVWQLQ